MTENELGFQIGPMPKKFGELKLWLESEMEKAMLASVSTTNGMIFTESDVPVPGTIVMTCLNTVAHLIGYKIKMNNESLIFPGED